MAKDNEEEKIKLKPYTAKNVIDSQNRKIKNLKQKNGENSRGTLETEAHERIIGNIIGHKYE